jgi:molybdopterin converting factor small subunit
VKVHLGGHLGFYEPERRANFEVRLAEPTAAIELVRVWGIPAGEVFLATVNNAVVDLDTAIVTDGDQLSLYPPAGGG